MSIQDNINANDAKWWVIALELSPDCTRVLALRTGTMGEYKKLSEVERAHIIPIVNWIGVDITQSREEANAQIRKNFPGLLRLIEHPMLDPFTTNVHDEEQSSSGSRRSEMRLKRGELIEIFDPLRKEWIQGKTTRRLCIRDVQPDSLSRVVWEVFVLYNGFSELWSVEEDNASQWRRPPSNEEGKTQ